MRATIAEVASAVGGASLPRVFGEAIVTGVSTDSRTVRAGELFVALRGESFDGHGYVGKAFAAGAAAALVSRVPEGLSADKPLVLVSDTLAAYQALGGWWRDRMQATVVGVTGSNGKTTTKEMLALVLAGLGPTMCSEANFNNHVGVPQTLLRIAPEHRYAIVEMGVNHFGEMAPIARPSRPNVALITNIGDTHLEAFGSRDGVAREKAVMLDCLAEGGLAVLHADEEWSRGIAARHPGRKVTFGLSRGADWRAVRIGRGYTHIRFTVERTGDAVWIPVIGRHQVSNAIAAIAVAAELGLRVAEAAGRLAALHAPKWRMEPRRAGGMTLLLDCYNANPVSMRGAVAELRWRRRGRRVAVLGDMLEVGGLCEAAHRELGRIVAAAGIEMLCTVGESAAALADEALLHGMDPANVFRTRVRAEAAEWLRGRLAPRDTVLFKASRGMRLEEVAEAIEAWADHAYVAFSDSAHWGQDCLKAGLQTGRAPGSESCL